MRVPSRRVSVTAKFTTSDLCDAGSDAPAASAHRTSVDDVIAAIDINRVAGDETRRVVREEGGGGADVVDTDEAAGRRLGFRFVEQGVKFRDAGRRARRQRPGRDRIDADALRAEFGGNGPDSRLERPFR